MGKIRKINRAYESFRGSYKTKAIIMIFVVLGMALVIWTKKGVMAYVE
jgi:hypothetical protein